MGESQRLPRALVWWGCSGAACSFLRAVSPSRGTSCSALRFSSQAHLCTSIYFFTHRCGPRGPGSWVAGPWRCSQAPALGPLRPSSLSPEAPSLGLGRSSLPSSPSCSGVQCRGGWLGVCLGRCVPAALVISWPPWPLLHWHLCLSQLLILQARPFALFTTEPVSTFSSTCTEAGLPGCPLGGSTGCPHLLCSRGPHAGALPKLPFRVPTRLLRLQNGWGLPFTRLFGGHVTLAS